MKAMKIYTGIKIDNSKVVTGDYCRSGLDGCWIGQRGKSGYWESKVIPDSVEVKETDENKETEKP